MARQRKRLADTSPAALHPAFIERISARLGHDAAALLSALDAPAPTSIRLNPLKPVGIEAARIPWCANGRYLTSRPAFTLDPMLHAGAYYVQEASSMILEQALIASGALGRDVLALDLCAAPGGKSTHLLSLLSEGSLLVANEPVAARRAILAENMWKHGATNAVVTGSDPADLRSMPEAFDVILVDAPCSGEGLFRKDAFAREQWSPQLVQQCATLQRRILDDAWHALAPGGCLIYSTCTWEREEDEAQAARLVALGAEAQALNLPHAWGIMPVEHEGAIGYLCFPHRLNGEGFFLSVLRKPGAWPSRKSSRALETGSMKLDWLKDEARLGLLEKDGLLYAMPQSWSLVIHGLRMRTHHPGVPFAETKAGTWRPHPAAALSTAMEPGAIEVVNADRETALAYLRGAALPAIDARGHALIACNGLGLGWAQGAGLRWNNRWPAPWRVRQAASPLPPVPWSEP